MFTGIIEALGIIQKISADRTNRVFWIKSEISSQLRIDESICHNGICLTVEEILEDTHRITAIQETLAKTNAGEWKVNDIINLERSLLMNGRLDGHIVQGHVDGTGICLAKKDIGGSLELTFGFDQKNAALIIEKGSICVNGVSLTAFNVGRKKFTVSIIPYTLEHTNFFAVEINSKVNIEFDVFGKYIQRIQSLRST